MSAFYTGCPVSDEFMKRWRSGSQIGNAKPWQQVRVRRGRLKRTWHHNWPNPQFGQVVGESIKHQWYADWVAIDDWTTLDGVSEVDLDQSFSNNGITVASVIADNLQMKNRVSGGGNLYHTVERGYLYPWRGYTPARNPGTNQSRNAYYRRLPNAQIEIQQGYGPDTAVKTFTGLIDSIDFSGRPDRASISARDFGGVLTDSYIFGWNKPPHIKDPITFVPWNYDPKQVRTSGKHWRWIRVKDVTDVVRCVLRWAGFKDWQVENAGVELKTPYQVDKSKSYMDVITDIQAQLGYVFFIAEPNQADDLSIGTAVFRRSQATVQTSKAKPVALSGKRLLTDFKPRFDNASDRYIIRVRGQLLDRAKGGRPLGGDPNPRVTFQYWPPWMNYMAGVIKQLTYYNIGDTSSVGFQTIWDCQMACMLIALQIALQRETCTGSTIGTPALGLDSMAYITDEATGVASRCYIANRKSTMKLGGDGTSAMGSGTNPIWATDFGGSLVDSPEWDHLRVDYSRAVHKKHVQSWGTPN